MVLDRKISFELLLFADVGDGLAVDEGADVVSLGDDAEVVPLAFFEGAFFLAEPAAKADAVEAAGNLAVDFDLVAFGFSFGALAAEGEAGVEAGLFGEEDFELGFEVGHLDLGGDPDVGFGEEEELVVFGFELDDFVAGCPAVGGFSVEKVDPLSVGGEEKEDEEERFDHEI